MPSVRRADHHLFWAEQDDDDLSNHQQVCSLAEYYLSFVALQCLLYVVWWLSKCNKNGSPAQQPNHKNSALWSWYLAFFGSLLLASALGGLMHQITSQAVQILDPNDRAPSSTSTSRVFGRAFDRVLRSLWRLFLAASVYNNFALFGLFATRYLGKSRRYGKVMGLATVLYACMMVLAVYWSQPALILLSMVPVIVLGTPAALLTWMKRCIPDDQDHHAGENPFSGRRCCCEVVMLGCSFGAALVLATSVTFGASQFFDHTALSHVFSTAAACLVLYMFTLDTAAHHEPTPSTKPSASGHQQMYGTFVA